MITDLQTLSISKSLGPFLSPHQPLTVSVTVSVTVSPYSFCTALELDGLSFFKFPYLIFDGGLLRYMREFNRLPSIQFSGHDNTTHFK